MRRILLILMLASLLPTGLLGSDEASEDVEQIRQAVLDYANSAYDVAPELLEGSVHGGLQKVGLVSRDQNPYRLVWMNYFELEELVSQWNQEGRFDSATAKRDIVILDRLDRTAVARLDAEWGVDYFQLAKIEENWKIVNVLWQTYPWVESSGGPDPEGCRSNDQCLDTEYCHSDIGSCGAVGECVVRPEMCTMDYQPVCGCDGVTYSNLCGAASAGVSVARDTNCEESR